MTIKLNNSVRSKLAVDNMARVIGADPDLNVHFLGPNTTPRINMKTKAIFYQMVTLVMTNTGSYVAAGYVMKVVIIVILNLKRMKILEMNIYQNNLVSKVFYLMATLVFHQKMMKE